MRSRKHLTRLPAVLMAFALLSMACGDDTTSQTTGPPQTVVVTSIVEVPGQTQTVTSIVTQTSIVEVEATEPPPVVLTGQERCQANRDAGTITFLTGFGYYPSASVAEVIVAKEMGFFDDMCLDVDIEPSLPGDALVLVNANVVQFAANSFGTFAQAVQAGAQGVIIVTNKGHLPIWTLATITDKGITKLEDFRGKTIGSSSGNAGAPIRTMLASVGLHTGVDYEEAAVGYDPRIISSADVDGIAGFRSNQPDTMRRAGFDVIEFWPEDYGGVGSFGAQMASKTFLAEHPTAAEDWIRATLKAWEWAVQPENYAQVIQYSADLTEGDLNVDHELFRWKTESETAINGTPEGWPMGKTIPDVPAREIAYMVQQGMLQGIPDVLGLYTNQYVDAVYDDNAQLIWPGPIGQ